MNYRHEFHAGNFADVLKHIVLTRILLHLVKKPAAFRYIDTHAGSGLYDLAGDEAGRTGEWRSGIGRLARLQPVAETRDAAALALIEPYLRFADPDGLADPARHLLYPGSPAIASSFMRPQDKLLLCELHPAAAQELRINLGHEKRAKIIEIDGFTGLNAFVPPVERRGLVLIDPAFEQRDDLQHSVATLTTAWKKWATGIFMLWYPIKDKRDVAAAFKPLVNGQIRKLLRIDWQIAEPAALGPLVANGLLIVNPPFQLAEEIQTILPFLDARLASDPHSGFRIEWLAGE